MREIKFRGKRLDNGKWTYGYLTEKYARVDSKRRYAIDCCWSFGNDEWESLDVHEVIPETVGQYTGVKDIEGAKIYEGDILQSQIGDKHIWQVIFYDGCFEIVRGEIRKRDKVHEKEICCFENIRWYVLTKIGNIHDNPELLEVEK